MKSHNLITHFTQNVPQVRVDQPGSGKNLPSRTGAPPLFACHLPRELCEVADWARAARMMRDGA
jgi:hypothetical protein